MGRATVSEQLTAVFYETSDGWIVGEIPGALGVHSQGKTLTQARSTLFAVLRDVLDLAPRQIRFGVRVPRGLPRGAFREVGRETIVLVAA